MVLLKNLRRKLRSRKSKSPDGLSGEISNSFLLPSRPGSIFFHPERGESRVLSVRKVTASVIEQSIAVACVVKTGEVFVDFAKSE